MSTLYNDIDAFAVKWLRRLAAHGFIAVGEVDARPIQEIPAGVARTAARVHWFAGIGGWEMALQWAGGDFPDGTWTGSCPCQPFSNAGQRKGTDDDRHLWPHWFKLIRECRPPLVFGEQVEGAISGGWIDEVADDLASIGYALDAVVLPATIVGAPHLRHRIYFAAYPAREGDLESGFDLFGDPLPAGLEPSARCRETIRWINGIVNRISPEYAHGWKHMETPAGRWTPVLRARTANRTVQGWPTPLALSFRDSHQPGTNRSIEKTRELMPSGWPTPVRRDSEREGKYARGNPTLGMVAGWATPRAADGAKHGRTPEGAQAEVDRKGPANDLGTSAHLAGWVSPNEMVHEIDGWPTPTRATAEGGPTGDAEHGRSGGANLQARAQMAGWPSPAASGFNEYQDPATNQERRERMKDRHGTYSGLSLVVAASLAGWTTPQADEPGGDARPSREATGRTTEYLGRQAEGAEVAGWGTPRAVESGHSSGNPDRAADRKSRIEDQVHSTDPEKKGSLAPEFSRWLMGYPPAWEMLATGEAEDVPGYPNPFTCWDAVRWIPCSDGKLRRIGLGIRPLAESVPGRVGMLRGFGNAIVPQVAAVFVFAFMRAGAESK